MDFQQRRRVDVAGQAVTPGQTRSAGAQSQRALRRAPRSASLIRAVQRLDAELDQAARDEFVSWIRNEYTREVGDIPLGFVAVCQLGPPFVDHILDLLHTILQHFGPADPMPEPFNQARMLARTGAYAYIEVYASGAIVPVPPDGVVVA
jgi:hypothetical protein